MNDQGFTNDGLLDGRIDVRQPKLGFRIAIDTVLLAASITAKPNARVLDLGAGVGGAALCFAARQNGVCVHGIDVQPDMIALAHENAAANGFDDRLTFEAGNVATWRGDGFDHVMANPPYFKKERANAQAHGPKATATVEDDVSLAHWAHCAAHALRHKGTFTLIFEAERLDSVLDALAGAFGGVVVFPLWPRAGAAAKRIIVSARKGAKAPLKILPGLILHDTNGYTSDAERVLRDAQALELTL